MKRPTLDVPEELLGGSIEDLLAHGLVVVFVRSVLVSRIDAPVLEGELTVVPSKGEAIPSNGYCFKDLVW